MYQPLSDQEFNEQLKSFADGELDAGASLAMSQYLCVHPEAMMRVVELQQLRVSIGRVMGEGLPRCAPAGLAEVIGGMDVSSVGSDGGAVGGVVGTVGVVGVRPYRFAVGWLSMAGVIGLAITLIAVMGNWGGANDRVPHTYFINAQTADRLADRHTRCSLKLDELRKEVRAEDLGEEIGHFVCGKLGCQLSINLDLRDAGYRFERFGNCPITGKGALHLIYKSVKHPTFLSVWVTPNKDNPKQLGDVDLGELVPFRDGSRRPIMAWKDKQATYYFVGDLFSEVKAAGLASLPVAGRSSHRH